MWNVWHNVAVATIGEEMTSAAPAPAAPPSGGPTGVPAPTNGATEAIAALWMNEETRLTAVWRIGGWCVIGG